jgi:hypothetical protein
VDYHNPSETGLAPESRVPELQTDTAKDHPNCSSPRQSATTPLQQVSRFARRDHAQVPVNQSRFGVAGLHPRPAGPGSGPAPQPPGCRYHSHRKACSEGPGWPVSIQLGRFWVVLVANVFAPHSSSLGGTAQPLTTPIDPYVRYMLTIHL